MSNSRILSKIPSGLSSNTGKLLSIENGEIVWQQNYAWDSANNANTEISSLKSTGNTQNTRLLNIENVNSTQNTNITNLTSWLNSNNTLQASINTTQNTNIIAIQGIDNAQNTRLTNIDNVNLTQNTNISEANTWLQANDYSTLTTSKNYTDTSNTNNLIYTNNVINSNVSLLAGVNTTQNTNISNLTSWLNSNNTLQSSINSTQNTNNQAAFTHANSAFASSNTKFSSSGGTISGNVIVSGTVAETVNSIPYLVLSEYDIGTDPNKIPLNGYLGDLAYQDSESVTANNLTLSGGTANGVAYINSNKQVVFGTRLVFDGNTFSINANSIIGNSSGNSLTINGTAVSIPNNLNFDSNTLFIDAANNRVGIGTSSPTAKLHVDGTGGIFSSGGFPYATLSQLVSSADAIFGGGVIADPSTGQQLKKTVANVGNFIRMQISDGISFHTGVTGAAESTLARTAFQRMTLDASGNLGIGVIPNASWNGGGNITIGALKNLVSAGNGIYVASNLYYDTAFKYSTTSYASYYYQYNGQHQWSTAPSGTAGSAISFTPAMTLDASGNLLVTGGMTIKKTANIPINNGFTIGTVAKNVAPSNESGNILIQSDDASAQLQGKISLITSATASERRLSIGVIEQAVGYRNVTFCEYGGNVGIGTSSPAVRFVASNSGANGYEFDPANSFISSYNRSTSTWTAVTFRAGGYTWNINNSLDALKLDSSGNVGIGTSSPGVRLDVVSISSSAVGARIRARSGSDDYGFLQFTNNAGTTEYAAVSGSSGTLAFYTGTASTERMNINSAGTLTLNQGQIKFPATQVASADANTLDDYEEGTWTCTLSPSSGFTPTSNSVTGYYTKIGNVVIVTAQANMTVPSSLGSYLNSDASFYLQISGLPFVISSVGIHARSAPTIGVIGNMGFVNGWLVGHGDHGYTSISIFRQVTNTRVSPSLTVDTSPFIHFQFTYRV